MRERTRRLARPHRRIDPSAIEEFSRDVCHFWRKGAVGIEHSALRVRPCIGFCRRIRERRVAVPEVERFDVEPTRLQPIVAMRQARIGLSHGGHERIDDVAFDAVGEVT